MQKQSAKPVKKSPYKTPRLVRFGNVQSLTKGSSTTGKDNLAASG